MKAKLKNAGAPVRLLLAHGEKVGMALVVVAAGMLIWSSLGREQLDHEPADLEQQATSANQHVQGMQWEAIDPQDKIVATRYVSASRERIATPVPSDAFGPWTATLDPPPVEPMGLRQDPLLLAALAPEATGGAGMIMTSDPATIRRKMLEARERMEQERIEAEREAERARREAEDNQQQYGPGGAGSYGGRGGPGGRGGRTARGGRGGGGYGGPATGGYGGGYGGGGYGGADGQLTEDAVMVINPRSGAPTQGFEDIRTESWVTVVAKVPFKAQYNAYEDALASARGYNPSTDIPKYLGYQVQRAEVTNDGLGEWQLIKNVVPKEITTAMSKWPLQTPEVANQRYVHPLLTFPLPPMVLRQWGAEASHSELPLPSPDDLAMGDMMEQPLAAAEDAALAEADPNAPFGEAARRAAEEQAGAYAGQAGAGYGGGGYGAYGAGGEGYAGSYGRGEGYGAEPQGGYGGAGYAGVGGPGGPGGYGGYGGAGYGGAGGPGGPGGPGGYGGAGYGGAGYGGGEGGYGGAGSYGGGYGGYGAAGGRAGADAGQITLPDFHWDGRTPFVLLRYFDFTAEPCRRYKYRVRLALADVNAGIPSRFLDAEVAARRDAIDAGGASKVSARLTEWSEPTNTASVPQPGLVFLAEAEPANESNYSDEPEARLVVKGLDSIHAAEIAFGEKFARGAVINDYDRKAEIIWSNTFEAQNDEGPVESPKFDFVTGLTLLDFRGGENLNRSRELTAPASALLMDGAGRLMLRHELEDRETATEYDRLMEQKKEMERQRANAASPDRTRGGGRGGYGGQYGGSRG